MGNKNIEYGILNIAASPHPKGIYVQLLKKAAYSNVNFHGDLFATISPPEEIENGFHRGRVLVWTEIDKNQPAVDKNKLEEIDFSDLDLNLPDNVGFNGKVFTYILREEDHMLFLQTKNDLGKGMSIRRMERIFNRLFAPEVQGIDAPMVEITVVPENDALRRILNLSTLKRLKIHIVRPNADDEDMQHILDQLEEQGAKSQDVLYVAASDSNGIKANAETKKQAEVAATNGFVMGAGYEEDGTRVELSTKKYPRIIRRHLEEGGSILGQALVVAKNTYVKLTGS